MQDKYCYKSKPDALEALTRAGLGIRYGIKGHFFLHDVAARCVPPQSREAEEERPSDLVHMLDNK